MAAITKQLRLFAMLLICMAMTVTALPRSADAAKLYNIELLMRVPDEMNTSSYGYMPVNYFISGMNMYIRLNSDKSPSTKTEALYEYSKDNGKTWNFLSRTYESGQYIRFPNDPEASVVLVRTSVKFNPMVGKDTRDTNISGPYKVYHLSPPANGVTYPLKDGTIKIAFKDRSNAEDYYRITRTGDGKTVTYRAQSFNDKAGTVEFIDTETNKSRSTKYQYYIEPVFDTVMLMPWQVPAGLTIFGETKPSLLTNIRQIPKDQLTTTVKFPVFKDRTGSSNESDPVWLLTIPVTLTLSGDDGAANVPTQAEIDEFNQLLDQTVASASQWARNDIKAATLMNLTTGEVLNNFQAPISRAHFAGLMVKMYEKLGGVKAPAPASDPFTDTDDEAVLQAYELGYVKGKTDTTFDPHGEITRQEIGVILLRFAHLQGLYGILPVQNYEPFVDQAKIAPWAADGVDYAAGTGLLAGTGKGNFSPLDPMTRESAIVLMKRIFDKQVI